MSVLKSILYVDDEPLNLKLFTLIFVSKYNIITALNGMDGLLKLSENPEITVVISDMKMPGMNGIEFITKARAQFSNISYFILTGFDITDEISEALKSGLILKYFRKPFDIREIETALHEAVL